MSQRLDVTLIGDAEGFERLAPDWNALAGELPFHRFEWSQTWWRHYSDSRTSLFVPVVRNAQGRIVGIAPWYLERSGPAGSAVRFLGSGEVCSDYLTVLSAPDMREAVAARLAEWLVDDAGDRWHLLDFDGVDAADHAIATLGNHLAERGHSVHREAIASCWRVTLPETWEEYLSMLSRSRRERTRKALRNLLDRKQGVAHLVATPDDLTLAWPILVDLHQRRRRSLAETGCFASPKFAAFHREMASTLLAQNRLALTWIELNGQPAAVNYCFRGGDTVYYYQGGFDPGLSSANPGSMCIALSLRNAIDQGYRTFDFLRGDEPYKASWQASARQLLRVRIVGRQASARVLDATRRSAAALKGLARRILVRN